MAELYLLVPGLPILLAAALTVPALRPAARALAPLAAVPALAAALVGPPALPQPWLMLGVSFGLDDGAGWAFLGFTAILWTLAACLAVAYHRDDPHRTGFFACFLMAMAGNLGLLVAEDVFSFYAFFATMSFASYGLVVHARAPDAYRAGRVYIGFVVAGELALFGGLALAATAAGSPAIADIRAAALPVEVLALMLAGFGIKLGLVPLHVWLPLAHAAAPVAASAVLSGAMIKAGLFGILSFVPLGVQAEATLGAAVLAAGVLAVPLSAVLGGTSDRPKAVLAWSSVGQMGLVAIALGVGLSVPAAWPALAPAVVFLAAHHALAKGALFLGVGAFLAGSGPAWRGLALLAMAVPAAALAAVPFTSGFAAKEAVKVGLAAAPDLAPWILTVLTASSAATALLMVRLFLLLGRAAPVARPRIIAVPALAAGLAVPLFPAWPLLPPGPVFPMPGTSDLAALLGGLAAGFALDALLRRVPVPLWRPGALGRGPRLLLRAPAVPRLRLAARARLAGAWAGALPRPGLTAAVLMLVAVLALEARTLVGAGGSAGGSDPAALPTTLPEETMPEAAERSDPASAATGSADPRAPEPPDP